VGSAEWRSGRETTKARSHQGEERIKQELKNSGIKGGFHEFRGSSFNPLLPFAAARQVQGSRFKVRNGSRGVSTRAILAAPKWLRVEENFADFRVFSRAFYLCDFCALSRLFSFAACFAFLADFARNHAEF
jgi:hypothetical protein